MTEIKIEKNVPAPSRRQCKYPFLDLKKGDSFFVKSPTKKQINTLRARASHLGKNGSKFKTSLVDSGIRVWKVS